MRRYVGFYLVVVVVVGGLKIKQPQPTFLNYIHISLVLLKINVVPFFMIYFFANFSDKPFLFHVI
jgi:hypothetical protein